MVPATDLRCPRGVAGPLDHIGQCSAEVTWQYRCCFTPDDPEWVATCSAAGVDVVDAGLAAVAGGSGGD